MSESKNISTQNEAGLLVCCDAAIYVEEDSLDKSWKVLRTRFSGHTATVMFQFATKAQAVRAGADIAKAIGGFFLFTTDPRKIKP